MKREKVDALTPQEACDYAVEFIAEQGSQCVNLDDGKTTCYSDEDGKFCSIGCLLDNNNKTLIRSGETVASLVADIPSVMPKLIINNPALFQMLQGFHDFSRKDWRQDMREGISRQFKIKTDAPHWQAWVDMGDEHEESTS